VRATCLLAGAVSCLWGAIGCGDDSDDGELDTPEFCAAECRERISTNCMATPMEYTQPECEMACLARHTDYPQCEAQLKAVDRCLAKEVTYVCNASGAIEATPAGACSDEIGLCMSCTNQLSACPL